MSQATSPRLRSGVIAAVLLLVATVGLTACASTQNAVAPHSPSGVANLAKVHNKIAFEGPAIWFDYDEVKVTPGTEWFGDNKTKLGGPADAARGTEGLQEEFLLSEQVNSPEVADWFNDRAKVSQAGKPKELAFAVCGKFSVAAGVADLCLGKPVLATSTKWYVGGRDSSDWYLDRLFNYQFDSLCSKKLAACLSPFNATAKEVAPVEIDVVGCTGGRSESISNAQLGCIAPERTEPAQKAISKYCVYTRECAFIGFNNSAEDVLDISAGKEISFNPANPHVFPKAQICKTTLDAEHGELVASYNTKGEDPDSSMFWMLLRSGKIGGDSRIAATVRIEWSDTGDCGAAPKTSFYSINWDPREKPQDGDRKPAVQCAGGSATGRVGDFQATMDCLQVALTMQGAGEPGEVTWSDITLAGANSLQSVIMDQLFEMPDTSSFDAILEVAKYVWSLISSGDQVLFSNVGLYAQHNTGTAALRPAAEGTTARPQLPKAMPSPTTRNRPTMTNVKVPTMSQELRFDLATK